MDTEFIKLTAAGVIILTAASAVKQKRAKKKMAPAPLNYDSIMTSLIPVG